MQGILDDYDQDLVERIMARPKVVALKSVISKAEPKNS